MSELFDLYQDMILDHSKNPRNSGSLEAPTSEADGHNPLCGDKIHIQLLMEGDVVKDLKFSGDGCAISTASSSIMSDAIIGKTREEIRPLFEAFHSLVTGKSEGPLDEDVLGKLAVFSGVSEFPMRVKCATLSWHTLNAALDNNLESEPVSTE